MLIGEFFALATAVLWAFTSVIFTNIANKIGTFMLNFIRLFLASIFLITTILLLEGIKIPSLYQIAMLGISGIIGLIIGDTFLFKSYTINGPRISGLIFSLNPAIGAILALILFGEVISFSGIVGILLTLLGISLVILSKKEKNNTVFKPTKLGILYAFIGALGQALGLIFVRYSTEAGEMSPLLASFIRNVIAIIAYIPMLLVLKKWKNPFKLIFSSKDVTRNIFIGSIIGPYLGVAFSLYAIAYTKIGIASAIMSSTPIILLPLSVIFFKEKLNLRAILGAVIAVTGVSFLFIFK